jgi:hypothetical protein
MPHPSHPPRLDHSNYSWRRVQITKFLVMQFPPSSRHFIPPQSEFPPRRPGFLPKWGVDNREECRRSPWAVKSLVRTARVEVEIRTKYSLLAAPACMVTPRQTCAAGRALCRGSIAVGAQGEYEPCLHLYSATIVSFRIASHSLFNRAYRQRR